MGGGGGGGGGGSFTKNRKNIPKNQIFEVPCGFCVFFSTLFRENVANLTHYILCFMIRKHIFHCASAFRQYYTIIIR